MAYRRISLIALILMISVTSSASAKVRDFQFIEDLSFAMPGELSIVQGLSKAEARRTPSTMVANGVTESMTNTLRTKSVVPTNINFGINERFEISLEVPYVFLDNTQADYNGLGDIGLTQKIRFSDQKTDGAWLSSGVGMRLEPPTGDRLKGLGSGKTDFEIFGLGMKEIGATKWLVNLGYNFVGGDKYKNEFKYNAGVSAAIHNGFSFLMEFSGISGSRDELYMAPGILLDARGISFRLGTQFGMNDDSYKYRWNFNLSNSF